MRRGSGTCQYPGCTVEVFNGCLVHGKPVCLQHEYWAWRSYRTEHDHHAAIAGCVGTGEEQQWVGEWHWSHAPSMYEFDWHAYLDGYLMDARDGMPPGCTADTAVREGARHDP